jgi:hypothetical protein
MTESIIAITSCPKQRANRERSNTGLSLIEKPHDIQFGSRNGKLVNRASSGTTLQQALIFEKSVAKVGF